MNNPVIYNDPEGNLPEWIAWLISGVAIAGGLILTLATGGILSLIGGALIGAGAGGLVNGYINKANGGNFWRGYIGGATSGFICGIGAGTGGLLFELAAKTINFAMLGYLSLGIATSFVGGFVGNILGTIVTESDNSGWENLDINWKETIEASILMGLLNVFAGFGSFASSSASSMSKMTSDISSKFAAKILAALIAGGTEAAYDLSSYFVSKLGQIACYNWRFKYD